MSTASVSACDKIGFTEINVKDMFYWVRSWYEYKVKYSRKLDEKQSVCRISVINHTL